MGLLKKIKKTVKRAVPTNINSGTQLIKDANKARKKIPTNFNEATGSARSLIGKVPLNFNSIAGKMRMASGTGGRGSAVSRSPENAMPVAYKPASSPAYNKQRYVDQSLSSMRGMAGPQDVQGARYGDINRGFSSRVPMQNSGVFRREMNNPNLGMSMSIQNQPMDQPSRVPQGRPIASGMASSQNVGMSPQNQKVQMLLNDQRRNSIPQNQAPQNTGVMGPQRAGMAWNPQTNGRPIRFR